MPVTCGKVGSGHLLNRVGISESEVQIMSKERRVTNRPVELAKIGSVEFIDLPTGHWPQFTRPAELARRHPVRSGALRSPGL
jgi:hypothetical protein